MKQPPRRPAMSRKGVDCLALSREYRSRFVSLFRTSSSRERSEGEGAGSTPHTAHPRERGGDLSFDLMQASNPERRGYARVRAQPLA